MAYTIYGHNDQINTVKFSKKGDFFATGGDDNSILVWKSAFAEAKGEQIKELGVC